MQHIHLFFWFIIGVALSSPTATITAQSVAPQLQIREAATGVRITLAGAHAATWPIVEIGDMEIPAQLVVVHLADTTRLEPIITTLDCRPWSGQLRPRDRPIPQANGQARLDLQAPSRSVIPTTPITLLREGHSRGQRLAVYAVVSIVEREGKLCQVTRLDATIPGAQVIDEEARASTTWTPTTAVPFPNPAASRNALTIRVRTAGMQRINGADVVDLIASGKYPDPTRLHLSRAGQEVAVQLIGAEDGRIDAHDELRFYAPAPGDRWNQTATYWLTVEDRPGQRMERRDSTPGSAPQRTTGQEAGIWQPRTLYDSTLPGADGDHWFADELRSGPDQEADRSTVPIAPTLPLAAGPVALTITDSAYTAGPHQLAVTAGTATMSRRWDGVGDWTQTITLDTDATSAEIALLLGVAADGVLIDRVQWTRPVQLDMDEQGATFTGEAGIWRYELHGMRDDQALYEVTDPAQPVQVPLAGGVFADGPEVRQYLLTGSTTLHTPEVQAHRPLDLITPREAEAVYLAPRAFHAALEPLIAHRRQQGYTVELIAVEMCTPPGATDR